MIDGQMTVSLPYAVAQILLLERVGFPKEAAFDIMGIDNVYDIHSVARVSASKLNSVFDRVETEMQDPLIGMRVGYEFRIANFAETGNIYSYCIDLEEVLRFNARYQPLAVDIGAISTVIETDEESGQKRYFLDYKLYCPDFHAIRHIFGLIFGAYGTAFRWLTWSSARDLKGVYFQQAAPEDMQLHSKIFQCPVYFDQPYNRIEFFEDSMKAALVTHNSVRRAQIVAKLETLIASKHVKESFMTSLRETVEQAIDTRRQSLPLVAEALGMSEGKFRRELKAANIQYREYLDEIRQNLFSKKFEAGLSFAQIAQELGYNDQSAFTKAFKRWHGVSPTKFTMQKK